MALAKQIINIPMAGGLETARDEKLVRPGSFPTLENAIFTSHGTVRKRNGYTELATAIAGGGSLSTAKGIASFLDELLLLDKTTVYSYSGGAEQWVDKGTIPGPGVRSTEIVRNKAAQTLPDMALHSGIAVYAWKDGRGGVRATVVDHASGVPFQTDVEVSSSGDRPRCLAIGTHLVITYVESQTLKCRRIDPDAPSTLIAAQTLRTDLKSGAEHYDVVSRGTDEDEAGVVAYHDSSDGVTVCYLLQDGTIGNPLSSPTGWPSPVTISDDAANCIGVTLGTSNEIYVAHHNTSDGVRILARNVDLTEKFAPATLDSTLTQMDNITGVAESATAVRWFYEQNAASSYNTLVRVNTHDASGTPGTAADFMRSVGLAHKAFRHDGATYVGLAHDSTLQATAFLADSAGAIHAKIAPRVGGGLTGTPSLPAVTAESANVYLWASLVKTRLVSEPNESDANVTFTLTGVRRSEYDFDAPERVISASFGRNWTLSGGVLSAYDSRALVEYGFHLFPENASGAGSASGGSMSDGTYGAAVIYQWIDSKGQIHRSAPQYVTTTLSGGGSSQKITYTIPTLRVTGKSNVTIEVYGTEASGSIYYKLTSTSAPVDNDTGADTVSFERTAADADILANEILYTVGGVVEHIGPPAAAGVFEARGRLWAIDAENRNRLWYTKRSRPDDGATFSDLFTVEVPAEGGDCVAIGELDDKVVVFKERSIYAIFGEGPNATGQRNTFSIPQLVTTDVGCDEVRSIVRTSAGLMFHSAKGIYLLDRSLRAQYIGEPVEAYNAETVTSAVLLDSENQVRFTTSDNVALVYDYSVGLWSTFTNHEAVAALSYQGTYHFVKSNGTVRKESSTLFTDGGTPYALKFVTAWIGLGGLQGFQRVSRVFALGDFKSAHKLRVRVGYDFQSYYLGTITFDPDGVIDTAVFGSDATFGDSAVFGGVADGVYQWRAHLKRQKCEAIRFEFMDTEADGEAYQIAALALQAGVKVGGHKMRAGKTLGAN